MKSWLSYYILLCILKCWMLLQLEKRVQYHEHLRPVCLPTAATDLTPDTICTVIGWGKKNDTERKYIAAIFFSTESLLYISYSD